VHPLVRNMAEAVRAEWPGACSVLAYGSALRDSTPTDTLIDFYILVGHERDLRSGVILTLLSRVVQPNVYYAEHVVDGTKLRCKYAVMTLDAFARGVSTDMANPYFWARFAQPTRLVWCRDDAARRGTTNAVATAMATACANAMGLAPAAAPAAQWTVLFENTYRTELRPEAANRAASIVEAQSSHYATISAAASDIAPVRGHWGLRRAQGKALSLLRLGKNAFTFQGGADYAAWKISRHSGVTIEVTDWQRRHPFLAGILILPKLLFRKGLR
jgi:hypothetical protein